jgi:endoglucanase
MMMLFGRACLLIAIALSAVVLALAKPAQAGQSGASLGKRGMSVPWLRWPTATPRSSQPYDVNQTLWTDSAYRKLRDSGVDFVRAIMPPQPLMVDDPIARARAVDQVGSNVDRVILTGLKVVVDLHFWPPGDVAQRAKDAVQNPVSRARFIRGEVQLAVELARRSQGSVALELMNEPWPCGGTGDASWAGLQNRLVVEIRKVAPRLPLVVTGCTGAVDSLLGLNVAGYVGDPNIIYTFHFYEPFVFTHQFTFSGGSVLNNVPFPPPRVGVSEGMVEAMVPPQAAQLSPGARSQVRDYVRNDRGTATIVARLSQVGQWAKRNGIPPQRVLLGEFGTPFPSSPEAQRLRPDQLRWVAIVRLAAEREGFAWCYWNNPREGAFDYDPATRFARSDVLQALGLNAGVKR